MDKQVKSILKRTCCSRAERSNGAYNGPLALSRRLYMPEIYQGQKPGTNPGR